jgi:hypothetical protein
MAKSKLRQLVRLPWAADSCGDGGLYRIGKWPIKRHLRTIRHCRIKKSKIKRWGERLETQRLESIQLEHFLEQQTLAGKRQVNVGRIATKAK